MADNDTVSVWNPDKQLSEQIILKNIVAHDRAMDLARRGIPEAPSEKPLSFNDRISLRFKGLNDVIPAQKSLIMNTRGTIKTNSFNKWCKKYKEEEDKLKNNFKEEDNDYNEIMAISSFLDECEQEIITARKTKTFKDDFVWEREDHEGEKSLELTPKFFNMLKSLEDSYESIYEILIRNEIVNSGVSTDEELKDKEIEEEQHRRIVES